MMAMGKPAPEELALLEPFRGRVPPRYSASRSCRRCRTARGRTACCCARRAHCCGKRATRSRTASGMTPRASAFAIEFLIDEPSFQPHHMRYIKNSWILGIDARFALSIRCNTARVSTISISTLRSSASPFGHRAIRCAPISPRRPPPSRGAQSRRHRGSGDRRSDRASSRPQPAAHSSMPARRSTVCSAPAAIGYRIGTRPRTGIAYWDVLRTRPTKPRYGRGIPETWWYDRDKAAKIEQRRWLRAETTDGCLYHPSRAFDDPDLVRDHARLVRGRAVCARRPSRAHHCAAFRVRYRRDVAHLRFTGRRFRLARRRGGAAGR